MSPMKKWWFAGRSVLLLAACKGPAAPTLLNPVEPTTALRITIATTGNPLGPAGYAACIDPASDGPALA